MCQEMSLSAGAKYLGLDWHLCNEILMQDLGRRKKRLRLGRVRRIAIDEIFVRNPSQYLTVVIDLDSGHVLYVAAGKDAATLTLF